MSDARVIDWIGREETQQGRVDPALAAMLAATLPGRMLPPAPGAVVPPLWHWIGFPPTTPTEDLGPEGHPKLGGFMPPVRLPRRMWASGDLTFHRPLHVGERLTRHARIADVAEKAGAAGPMVFVTVAYDIAGEDGLAIEERQNIVYLEMPESFRPPKPVPVPPAPLAERIVDVDAPLLFRFSAVTFNAHRIHYDHAYAREVEKYPDLVVHGPLQAMLLAGLAADHRGTPPARFAYRGVHPMFNGAPLRVLVAEDAGAAMTLCTAKGEETQGMQANATWEDRT
ncbi:hypothetical protein ROJ8625_02756 [Roseivivax jejudonensis]|uniref:FAS1-like dehydratase domain-containing protein n=1 Tax=Roseivivax jejudonensis TaxID=1529041 RepID=A0A1X6ZK32_9RHOB|nr:MaoC family dehydratase N-terminal domain-containing protein [Roseivivax jejudonensis]SLN53886.1 hypothetical protein ROJ8625_02756 [Roseivivax jejudonensis]